MKRTRERIVEDSVLIIVLEDSRALLYDRAGTQVAGVAENEESQAVLELSRRHFLPIPGYIFSWLLFPLPGGEGRALLSGPIILHPGAPKALAERKMGCECVPTTLHQTILNRGPAGLRWNGDELVAAKH